MKRLLFYAIFVFLLFLIGCTEYTTPDKVFEHTTGEFTINTREFMSFQDYIELVAVEEELVFMDFDIPQLFGYHDFDFTMPELDILEYYDPCTNKKLKINFTDPDYSVFNFNYKDTSFRYKVFLYRDLHNFSENLKNQDCYFVPDKYVEGYWKDPYNARFLDAISNDFASLKDRGYSNDEIVEIATLFVQSIRYGSDSDDINRYPYETIFEKEGNCLDKSLILYGILDNLGYKTYIITGTADYEPHAIVGIICDYGDIEYDNQNICYIETSFFMPIGEELDMNVEEYITASNGTLVYSGGNYGQSMIESFDLKKREAWLLTGELNALDREIDYTYFQMCMTDCTYCDDNLVDPIYCNDSVEYNTLLDELTREIEEYNSLVNKWYNYYYEMEKVMFGNVELLERNS